MYTRMQLELNLDEQRRYDEISFCVLILRLLSLNNISTVKVHSLIDILGELAGCNPLIYQDLVTTCMMQDIRFMPRKEEQVWIARKLGLSVRNTTAILKISQRTYYEIINTQEIELVPRFSIEQYNEMIKLLNSVSDLLPERSFYL